MIIATPLRRRTPATLTIAIELPNFFFKDDVNNESTAAIVVLNTDIRKVSSTGGDYFQFDAQSIKLFGGDTVTDMFLVSMQLRHFLAEMFPLYITIVPPNQSWTFLDSEEDLLPNEQSSILTIDEIECLRFMELQRFSLEIIGSLYLASPSDSTGRAVIGACASLHDGIPMETTGSDLSPSPMINFALRNTAAADSSALDILTICVAVAVEMNDRNDAMKVIGIPILNKPSAVIVTTSNRNELEDARKFARRIVEDVGYKGREEVIAFCNRFTHDPHILSASEYRESTIESICARFSQPFNGFHEPDESARATERHLKQLNAKRKATASQKNTKGTTASAQDASKSLSVKRKQKGSNGGSNATKGGYGSDMASPTGTILPSPPVPRKKPAVGKNKVSSGNKASSGNPNPTSGKSKKTI